VKRGALALCGAALLGWAPCACTGHDELVFQDVLIEFDAEQSSHDEAQGLNRIEVRLSAPAPQAIDVKYSISSQDGNLAFAAGEEQMGLECRRPDALLSNVTRVPDEVLARSMNPAPLPRFEGILRFEAGQRSAWIELWVVDDNDAELDEVIDVTLLETSVGTLTSRRHHRQTIVDNDRRALINVVEYGADATAAVDTTKEIQTALDAASATQDAVVYFPAGSYLVSALRLSPGIVVVGYGAQLIRPVAAGDVTRTLTLAYAGQVDALKTVISGLTIDGQRDTQGAYAERKLLDAHLIEVTADAFQPGRAHVTLENVALKNGPGSGVAIGPGVYATLCDIDAVDIWRDAIDVGGGGTKVVVTGLSARGNFGTTGVVVSGAQAFLGSNRVEFTLRDSVLGTGDIEIDVSTRSEIELQRVLMEDAHFKLAAARSNVRVSDSVIRLGTMSAKHNYFWTPSNVRFSNTDLHFSEVFGERPTVEAARVMAMIEVDFNPWRSVSLEHERQQLSFVNCRFHTDDSVEADDVVYVARVHPNGTLAADSEDDPMFGVQRPPIEQSLEGSLEIVGGSFDRRFDELFAPDCNNCRFRP
jgi:hypothetical protein